MQGLKKTTNNFEEDDWGGDSRGREGEGREGGLREGGLREGGLREGGLREGKSTGVEGTQSYVIQDWEDENLNLDEKLIRGIFSAGFEKPSPIQKKACYAMIHGKRSPDKVLEKDEHLSDVIGQAQSGTGKTGCFVTSVLQIINEKEQKIQSLIMAPTRELASQIEKNVKLLGNYMNIDCALLIGGEPLDENRRKLEKNPHIIVGTPGRVLDCFRRRYIPTGCINLLVLDEADEMLSAGFKEQIYDIFEFLPKDVRVGLFSATMPPELEELTRKFLRTPIKILVKADMLTLEGIAQYKVQLSTDKMKLETLIDIFENLNINQSIIYCNSVERCEDLYYAMLDEKFPVRCIHRKLTQAERTATHAGFIRGEFRVLIATDIYARGIDVQQVQYVVNFDVPRSPHTYLHRIGRSGRWGRKGIAINFVNRQDYQKIKSIEEYYHTEVQDMPMNYNDHLK